MATHDHEIVSIYGFSMKQIDQLMTDARECVLMWATRDGWPVGVVHAYVWQDERVWLTFAAHRHRAEAIRRNPRVSVCVSGATGSTPDCPRGSATMKGRAILHGEVLLRVLGLLVDLDVEVGDLHDPRPFDQRHLVRREVFGR